jgi:type IX secretion system PorP/SprF family membrane protein
VKYFKYIVFAFMVLMAGRAKAQQDPLYTQYMNQLLSINPANAGAKGSTSATMLVRMQPIKGNAFGDYSDPRTITLFVHSPWGNDNGLGGSIVSDKFGPEEWTGFFADYSFSITYPGNRYLSLGLKAGWSWYRAMIGNQMPGDPAFVSDVNRPFLPNAGVGVYYSSPDFYVGFSIPKLISNRITDKGVETGYVSREQIHAFFMGGYVFDMNRIIKFKPYFMARVTPNAPLSLDVTAQFVFIDKLWIGGTYRLGNAVGFMAQVQLSEQMRFGVAYDLTTTDLRTYNTGIIEGMFTFDFSFGRSKVRSPRYF